MDSSILLKALKRYLGTKQLYASKHYSQENAGFSLIEVIAVVVMIGILAAIALPSWSAFVNRQRVNKANDAVLAAIQQAQTEAKKQKRDYSVRFTTNTSQVIKVAVYASSDSLPIDTNEIPWQSLGGDLQIPAGAVLLRTNMSSTNTVGATASTSPTITFDYLGTLPNANFGTPPTGSTEAPGLKIAVATSGLKRCVIVKTLLGTTLTEKDSKCD
jgi:prepilin-type N-terminal cleavage/methylation domain-containing protein